MVGQRFIKGQRVVTPDGPGKIDGYGYPAGANQAPSSIWVYLDTPFVDNPDARASNGAGMTLRGFPLTAEITPEPGSQEPTALELAANQVIEQAREMANQQDGKCWVNANELDKIESNPFYAQFVHLNALAEALGQPVVWTFAVYKGDDDDDS